ncbi:MAG: phospholipid carrier-dependent glycosyltransferase, partial [Desulfovibrio sp.]|nr:phospholipid carrier-dependent glycosyltransferase [Desulfovibrio sp.]
MRVVTLVLFFVLLYLLPLGNAPLRQPDETRYAEISREMLESGDWVTPRLLGLRYFEKPVAGYWVNGLSQKLLGETTFAARLGPALCTGASALMVGFLAFVLWRRRETAFHAVLIHLSMLMVLGIGTYNVLDAIFSMWTNAAMCCSWFCFRAETARGRVLAYAALGVACGLAFLTKGLPGPAVAVCACLPVAVLRGEIRRLFLYGPIAILCAVAVALPWSLAIAAREPDFWNYFFWVEHIQRFAGEKAQHREPFWFYLPWFVAGTAPWIGFLPGALRLGLAGRRKDPGLFFLASWALMPLLLFSVAAGKLPTYLLPCMAPLALLFAFYTGLHANSFECGTPKFLENRRNLIFQKVADFASAIPIRFLSRANWRRAGGLAEGGSSANGQGGCDAASVNKPGKNPFKVNACINLGLSLAGLAAFPVLYFDLPPGPPIYVPEEKYKLWLCALALVWWGLCAFAALVRKGKYWPLAAASPLLISLLGAFLLPWRITDQREPEHLIAPHLAELSGCKQVLAGTVGLGAGLAFMLKRSDVRLYNEQGELAYGLSYADGKERSVSAVGFADWLAWARAQGPVAMLVR